MNGRKSDTTSFGIAQRRIVVLYVWCGVMASSRHAAVMASSSLLKGETQSWVALLCPMVALWGWLGRAGSASHRAISSTETSVGPSWGTCISEIYHFLPFLCLVNMASWRCSEHLLGKIRFQCSPKGENHKACDIFKSHYASKAMFKYDLSGTLAFCIHMNFIWRGWVSNVSAGSNSFFESPRAVFPVLLFSESS